ncbi:MAG: hypothetical protein WC782_13025 [Methylococcaceae bacterium]|jgi:CPA1 family monovalent cation:H+ antiporter
MHLLGIDALTPEEEVGYHKSKAQMYDESLAKIDQLFATQNLTASQHQILQQQYQRLHQNACLRCKDAIGESRDLVQNMLRIYALGIEKDALKDIYQRGEINEKMYKKILNMLSIQTERVERGHRQVKSADEHFPIDTVERFVLLISRLAFWRDHTFKPEELYLYYRTLNTIIGKVVEALTSIDSSGLGDVFDDHSALLKLQSLYSELHLNTKHKMEHLIKDNAPLLNSLNQEAAEKSLHAVQQDTLTKLHKNEIITNKLYIMLHHELMSQKKPK